MFLSLGSNEEVTLQSACHYSTVLWSANVVWEVAFGNLGEKLVLKAFFILNLFTWSPAKPALMTPEPLSITTGWFTITS